MTVLLLALAGGLGAALRFVVDSSVNSRVRGPMPLGSFAVNVLGSFALGLATALALAGRLPSETAVVVGTGFCGGFTTFGTASVETLRLARDARPGLALVHSLTMLTGCLLAAGLGLASGTVLAPHLT